jgi:hypothetical protein
MHKEHRSPDHIEMDEMRTLRGKAMGLTPVDVPFDEVLGLTGKLSEVVDGNKKGVVVSALLLTYLFSVTPPEDTPSIQEMLSFVDEGTFHLSAVVKAMRETREGKAN